MDFGSALKAVLLDRAECTDKGQQIAEHNALIAARTECTHGAGF